MSLSLNQRTTQRWTVAEAVDGCVRHGLEAVGLWREDVAGQGLAESVKLVRAAGLRVSSLCRGGFLTAGGLPGDEGRRALARALDDNRRAVDEAAELGAACLVMVVGGLPGVSPGEPLPAGLRDTRGAPRAGGTGDGGAGGTGGGSYGGVAAGGFSRDLAGARERVAEALAELAPYAGERGVKLALEPLHPVYCPDRAVLSTLGQALDLSLAHPEEQVGVVVDTFHVWWDPRLSDDIARAGRRIASYQVCDYLHPLPADVLLGRGMMGDGVIAFPPITQAVLAAGYAGDIEVEIFNADVWAADPDEVVTMMKARYEDVVLATR
ncbi:sugar phosphate isomerase/epimerase [Nonomuraea sp. KC401]|uniref:sugar phosphate isomerase/epimerase family protein n=1 Tax=unclassified Nonomuraea TaxID=2593643 RepID=UPI0010FD0855|nr:sugar phosphate isomerase/epimerase family protein [Nonomuraea sp. KC401]NBE92523.1 TIM barrel protein [Nonomuraea sp. K271]TLF62147.1 sugar phosphate isomerase/epimerase [Nonomuraea sp. KC401]